MDDLATQVSRWRHWLVDWLASELRLDRSEIQTDVSLMHLGLDSVNAIMLVGDLEDQTRMKLPPTLVWDHPTVDSLAARLATESASPQTPAEVQQSMVPNPRHAGPSPVGEIDRERAQELLARLDELSESEVDLLLAQLKQL